MSPDEALRAVAQELEKRFTRALNSVVDALREAGASFNALAELVAELKAADPELARELDAAPERPGEVDPRPGPPQRVDFGPPRYCEACGALLVRRRSAKTGRLEPPHHFAVRRFCDQVCSGAYRRTVTAPDTKTCEECGQAFERPPTAGHAKFLERKYCSTSCSGKARGRRLAARRDKKVQAQAEPKAARTATPRSEPRPAPRPKPRPPLPRPDEKRPPRTPQAPIKAAPKPAPAPAPKPIALPLDRPVGEHRMDVLGEPCPHHPTERINAFGKCPACVAGGSWAARQRDIVMRPHPDGGR